MRILSARITRVRRNRHTEHVEAIVALTAYTGGGPVRAFIRISAPARAPGAARLRDRILGAAKLSFAADPARSTARRAA
ncbi:hypothetical protein [Defluviimonas sp. SAOS-178_SWC]|uniref:hypothetical protein n=1 Tax=Defluviimonas sp. SAOS-178_SWC TaxID=3121287 RepID=UPI003221B1D1